MNILYCYPCTSLRVTKRKAGVCSKCKQPLENIGWLEAVSANAPTETVSATPHCLDS